VVGVNPTFETPVTFPGGRIATQSTAFTVSSADKETRKQIFNRAVRVRAEDANFAISELERINRNDSQGLLTNRLDLNNIGIMGHSLGGDTVLEAMGLNSRFNAGLVLDGGNHGAIFDDKTKQKLNRPFMVMYAEGGSFALQSIYRSFLADTYRLTIEGSKHNSFSDIALFPSLFVNDSDKKTLPVQKTLGSIEPKRAMEIINTYAVAFFNKYLKNQDQTLLKEASSDYPEVKFEFYPKE